MKIKYPKSNLLSIVGALILSVFSMSMSAQCQPSIPVNLAVSNIQADNATFSWEVGAALNGYGYYFEVRESGAFLSGAAGLVSGGFTPSTTITVNNLPINSNLIFYVKYVCEEGDTFGSPPESIAFTTPNLSTPVASAAIFVENDSFLAVWEAVPGATGYLLDVATTITFDSGTFVTYVSGVDENFDDILTPYEDFYTTATSRIIDELNPETSYYYRVRAVTGPPPADFTTPYSNVITVMTVMDDPLFVTWTTGGWTSDPTTSLPTIIDADFDSALHGNIIGLTLTVNSGVNIIIRSMGYVRVINGITNNAGADGFVMLSDSNLFQENEATNTGDITVRRESSLIKRLDYTIWSSPTIDGTTADQTLKQFSPMTFPTRFYILNTLTNDFNSVDPLTTTFAEGKGYLIRVANNHPVSTPTKWEGSFKGIPNNGLVNVGISNDGPGAAIGFNMVGNPYASAISANEFIEKNTSLANPNITPIVYFWRRANQADGDGSDPYDAQNTYYATYGYLGGTATSVIGPAAEAPNGFIKPGQGFIVRARNASATSIFFDNTMRSYQHFSGQFFRNTGASATIADLEKHRMWLNLTSAEGAFSQMLLGYVETGSNEVDDFDGLYINDGAISMSSYLNNAEYKIQGRALPFDVNDVVPLNYKTPFAGTYSISIDHVDGMFTGDNAQTVFLRDNLLNVVHNLSTPYTFATEIGSFNDRFDVLYQSSLSVNNPELNDNAIVVFKQSSDIMINAGTAVIASVKVYDIRGRLLVEKTNVNASETSVYTGTDKQVLIVQITSTENITVTKKVIN